LSISSAGVCIKLGYELQNIGCLVCTEENGINHYSNARINYQFLAKLKENFPQFTEQQVGHLEEYVRKLYKDFVQIFYIFTQQKARQLSSLRVVRTYNITKEKDHNKIHVNFITTL
jgi:hypothetical protein